MTVKGFHQLRKLFMNGGTRQLHKLDKNAPEDVGFHSIYGASAIAILDALHKLNYHALVPKRGWFSHFL